MPLYECHCARCDLTFEALAPLSAASARSHPCPECGRAARRMLSAVAFGRSGGAPEPTPARHSTSSRPDVTELRVPPPAQLCWMDGPSTARYAAHLHGRGAEYDETLAAREDAAQRRGEPVAKPAPAAKGHSHDPHDHSPLADPAVYARRRAAAARAKPSPPVK